VRLDLVVGPNGAGKTTFVHRRLAPALPSSVRFVNADEIARQRWPSDEEAHAYDAARVAAETRSQLIKSRQPFVAETVFSHPSKLELIDEAHRAGFFVALHVLLVPEQLVVPRVRLRVAQGGHSVPDDKVLGRYRRLWPLVAEAIRRADSATGYDSSSSGPVIVARFVRGLPVGEIAWPDWTPAPMRELWPNT
jgi:predicted ABC-type ATPase